MDLVFVAQEPFIVHVVLKFDSISWKVFMQKACESEA
jgi:hypothetical protein